MDYKGGKMSILTYQDGSISLKENQVIFAEGRQADSVNILLQGKVDVFISPEEQDENSNEIELINNSFRILTLDKGSIIGSAGLYEYNKHLFSLKACEDSTLYVFPTPTTQKLNTLLNTNKDYGAFLLTSIVNQTLNCETQIKKLKITLKELRTITNNLMLYFWHLAHEANYSFASDSDVFNELKEKYELLKANNTPFPQRFDKQFFNNRILDDEYEENDALTKSDIEFLEHLNEIPIDTRKPFFGSDTIVTNFIGEKLTSFLYKSYISLKSVLTEITSTLNLLYSVNSENNICNCILSEYMKGTCDNRFNTAYSQIYFHCLDYIQDQIEYWSQSFSAEYLNNCKLDYNRAASLVQSIKMGDNPFVTLPQEDTEVDISLTSLLPDELHESAKKILEYAEFPEEKASLFLSCLETFRHLRDKFSLDEETVRIRKTTASMFFDLYEAVEKKVILEKNSTRLYHMFLTFGYMDERLLTTEQTISLYNSLDKYNNKDGSNVYTMQSWLNAIYEMKKDPSINEFSMDYFDVFRDMKKRGEITDKEKQSYSLNQPARLQFEVHNMFKANHRLCYGQPMSYFPILHSDMMVRKIEKSLITTEMIEASLNKILERDYSAFHREITYKSPYTSIEKELIMKKVLPDIILMPIFGTRPIMWQEISGKNRSTPGRFLIPILSSENLDDMMIKLVGNFRWELCRTMMGVAWNDITQKSLTSEYTDYIQFYKKNKDLSDDAKEKIAAQNTKYRSLMRDIFTSDYEQWFNYEAKGVMRLNKVSRSILFKYCPFNKETREQLYKHPAYSEISTLFRNIRAKQIREIENRYNKYTRQGIQLDEDLKENLRFYKEY